MALQQDFAEFFERENGVKLGPRKLKDSRAKDRIEVEEWRLREMDREVANARQERDAMMIDRDKAKAELADAEEREKSAKDHAKAIAAAGLALVEEMTAETVRFTEEGKIDVEDLEAIRPGLPELAPLLREAATLQRDRDEKRKFISKQIKKLELALESIRSIMPAIRHYLTKKPAIEKEVRAAKVARKDIIGNAKILRETITTSQKEAARLLNPRFPEARRRTTESNPGSDGPDL